MPFDPSKSFTVVEEAPESGFDPAKEFKVLETPSGFDPGKAYKVLEVPETPKVAAAEPSLSPAAAVARARLAHAPLAGQALTELPEKPLVPLPAWTDTGQGGVLKRTAQQVYTPVKELGEFIESPKGAGLLMAGAAAPEVVGPAIAVQSIPGALQEAWEAEKAYLRSDVPEMAGHGVKALIAGSMVSGLKGLQRRPIQKPPARPPATPPPPPPLLPPEATERPELLRRSAAELLKPVEPKTAPSAPSAGEELPAEDVERLFLEPERRRTEAELAAAERPATLPEPEPVAEQPVPPAAAPEPPAPAAATAPKPEPTLPELRVDNPLVKEAIDRYAARQAGFDAGRGRTSGLSRTLRQQQGLKLWEDMTPEERYNEFKAYAEKDFQELKAISEPNRLEYMEDRATDPFDPMSGVFKVLLQREGYRFKGNAMLPPIARRRIGTTPPREYSIDIDIPARYDPLIPEQVAAHQAATRAAKQRLVEMSGMKEGELSLGGLKEGRFTKAHWHEQRPEPEKGYAKEVAAYRAQQEAALEQPKPTPALPAPAAPSEPAPATGKTEGAPVAPPFPKPVQLPRKGLPESEREAEFQRYLADVDRHEAELKAWEAAWPKNKPILFAKPNGGYELITPDPQGGWRATAFSVFSKDDPRLMPWGHERYKTRYDAVKEYAQSGKLAETMREVLTEAEIKAKTGQGSQPRAEQPTAPKATETPEQFAQSLTEFSPAERDNIQRTIEANTGNPKLEAWKAEWRRTNDIRAKAKAEQPTAPAPEPKPEATGTAATGEDPIARIDKELAAPYATDAIKFGLNNKKAAILKARSQGQASVPYQHTQIGSNRWAVVDVATGSDKEFPVSIDHPERGRIETGRRLFKTRTEAQKAIDALAAKPATPPAQAAAKVEAEVRTVARTEGQRPAKEVKSELIDRLERAIDVAPSESEVGPKSSTELHGKTTVTPDAADKITIDIPGDGVFTIRNTKEALEAVLKRATKISTSSGATKPIIPKGAVQSSEEVLRKADERKAAELAGKVKVNQETARGSLYDAINKTDTENIVGSSKPEDDPQVDDGTMWKEWRIRKATPQEREQHWKGNRAEIRWIGERRVVKFSKEKGRTEGQWLFDDSGKTRADVIRGMEANMPKDATLIDEGLKQWRNLEKMEGGYAFLREGKSATPPAAKTEPPASGGGATEPMKGVGAAAYGETVPSGMTATGIKNAAVDAQRAQRGLPPIGPAIRDPWPDVYDRAMATLDRDPGIQDRIINELKDKPRPLSPEEVVLMLQREAELRNEYARLTREINLAHEDGRLEDLGELQIRLAETSDRLTDLEMAVTRGRGGVKGAGTAAGQALAARKMMMNEDYSLAQLEASKRAANGGRRLTDTERAELKKIADEYKAKSEALEAAMASKDQRMAELEAQRVLAELKAQAAAQPKYESRVLQMAERFATFMDNAAHAALTRLKERMRGVSSLDPAILGDLAVVGAAKITRGAVDFAKWGDAMVRDVGDWVKPHLKEAWDEAQRLFAAQLDKYFKPLGAAGQKAQKAVQEKLEGQPLKDSLVGKIQKKAEKDGVTGLGPLIQKLAREFVKDGIQTVDELVNAVHDAIQDVLPPEWTKRDTMDAISNYGQYKTLNKQDWAIKLRDLKGQMQQLAKLEDIANKQAPWRTGVERRVPSDIERRLIRQVNEAKRIGNYALTDPNLQLRTALDEVKRKMTNEIADIKERFRTGDFAITKRSPVRFDKEAMDLQARLQKLRDDWHRELEKDRLAHRHWLQKVGSKFVQWRRGFLLSSPVVFGKLGTAALTRLVTTTTEEAVGGVLGKVPGFRRLARQAPREGGFNAQAIAKGMMAMFREGIQDAIDTAKTGQTKTDVLLGKRLSLDKDWSNIFGQLHGMMKAPVKRFEIELSLEKRINDAIRHGVDVTDDAVKMELLAQAVNDGYRSIFMQKSFGADMFTILTSAMEKSKRYPVMGEISARALRFLFPIVRVPANIVAETATGIVGAPLASARLMVHATRGTLDALPAEVKDSILRQFKKGSIGLGLMAIGYFNPGMVGGYDWREKRKAGAVKTAGFQVGGVDIPRWATHAPWFLQMQFGATIRHVKDEHVKGEAKGISEGAWAAAFGLAEETPFYGELLQAARASEGRSGRVRYLGELAQSSLVPQAVAMTARVTDLPRQGALESLKAATGFGQTPVKRTPQNMWQAVEMGIPGMRQNVPKKGEKPRIR